MANEKTGAIIVLERNTSLDFLKETGEPAKIDLSKYFGIYFFQERSIARWSYYC